MMGTSQNISSSPPLFDGENLDYWKDMIKSFFLAYDADLWDMVTDEYIHPVDESGQKMDKKRM